MFYCDPNEDGTACLTASEARAEYFREAGFCRGDADNDFDAEQLAWNEYEDSRDFAHYEHIRTTL
jgi:hypothetical protein